MAVGSTRRELHAIEKRKRSARFKMRMSFTATAAALGSVIAVTAVAAVYNTDQPSFTAEPFSTPEPTLTGLGTPDQGNAVAASEEEVAIMAAAELITAVDTIAVESPEVLAARKDLEELVASFNLAQDPALIKELTGREDAASRDQVRADLTAPQDNSAPSEDQSPSVEQTEIDEDAEPAPASQEVSARDTPVQEPADAELAAASSEESLDQPAIANVTLEDIEIATAALEALLGEEQMVAITTAAEVRAEQHARDWQVAKKLADSTGSYSNGMIPAAAMTEISFAPGQMVRADAAFMLELLNDDFKAVFGYDIAMTDSYRSYSSQVVTKANKGYLAATPGRSNHGWGLALDLRGNVAKWGTPERNWLVRNGAKYGWISPSWAQPGQGKEEPWHWEFEPDSIS